MDLHSVNNGESMAHDEAKVNGHGGGLGDHGAQMKNVDKT